jgi:predicted dehydrogenase
MIILAERVKTMTDRNIKIAIIGAGYMAREHILAFRDIAGVEIAGIYSRTRSKAEALAEEFGIAGVHDTVEELYHATNADLVVVTVVEPSMNQVSKECFRYPWTVLLEKPPGMDVVDAEDILAAAKAESRLVLVALNRRCYSATRAVLENIEQFEGPRYIRVCDQQDQAAALAAGQPEIVARNWMYANSIHTIDYLRLFGRGTVTKVRRIIPWNPEKPWVVLAEIEFAGGDIGVYEGIWRGPGPWAVMICTHEKRWEMRPLEQVQFQLAGQRQLNSIETHVWDKDFKPGLRLQAELVVKALTGGTLEVSTLAETLETMRLIHEIFRTS